MEKLTPLVLLFLFIGSNAFGQDPSFSQYDSAPLHLNPSLAGAFNGAHRISANYRNQWFQTLGNDSYRSGMLSYDSKIELKNSNQFGFGFHTLIDRAGSINFGTNEYNLSGSYKHILGNSKEAHHALAIGFSFGLAKRRIDEDALRWPVQNSNGGFIPTIAPEEGVLKINYSNISSGILWNYISNTRFSIQIGLAAFHLNKPNISFLVEGETNLDPRYVVHGNVELPLSKNISFINTLMYNYQGSLKLVSANNLNLFTTGLFCRRYFNETTRTKYIQAGLYLRHLYGPSFDPIKAVLYDAVVNLNLAQISIGFSYDRHPNFGSSFEISAGYIFAGKNRVQE